jgi:hypothetical protein
LIVSCKAACTKEKKNYYLKLMLKTKISNYVNKW